MEPSQATPPSLKGAERGENAEVVESRDASLHGEDIPRPRTATPPGAETLTHPFANTDTDILPGSASDSAAASSDSTTVSPPAVEGQVTTQALIPAEIVADNAQTMTEVPSGSVSAPAETPFIKEMEGDVVAISSSSSAPLAPTTPELANSPAYDGPPALPFAPAPVLERSVASPEEDSLRRHTIARVLLLVGVSTLCAGLSLLFGYVARKATGTNQLSFDLFTLDGLRYWLPGIALAFVTGGAVLLVAGRRASPGLSPGTAWIFPFVTMWAGLLVISVYHDRTWWIVAPVITWIALMLGTVARLFLTEPSGGGHDVARTVLTIVSYVVAFLALAMIYITKLRSIFSATTVVILCVLLLVQMTDGEIASLPRRLVYAIVGGLIIGQVTWVINYWSAAGWTGGAFLLAVFYLIAGLSAAQLRDRIGLFDVIEFGGVALIALAIVSAAVLYQS